MGEAALKLVQVEETQPESQISRGFRIKIGRLVMVAVVAYFLVLYGGQQVHIARLRSEIDDLGIQIALAQEKNDRLGATVSILESDEYIELVARRELGLVRPGETPVGGIR